VVGKALIEKKERVRERIFLMKVLNSREQEKVATTDIDPAVRDGCKQ
jgi:hypothetical protein